MTARSCWPIVLLVVLVAACQDNPVHETQPSSPETTSSPEALRLQSVSSDLLQSPLQPIVRVSLLALLVRPEAFDRKSVFTLGYFDGGNLCVHREDSERLLRSNCVVIELPTDPAGFNAVKAYKGEYVMVGGRFAMGLRDDSGFPGAIERLTAFSRMPSRQEISSKSQ